MTDLTEAFKSYTSAVSQHNVEVVVAEPTPAAAAPPVKKSSSIQRFVKLVKRYLCCCSCTKSKAIEAAVVTSIQLPAPAAAYTYSDYIPEDMIVGFDGKLVKSYNPASSDPCPHYIKTTSMTTGDESCLNCGTVLNNIYPESLAARDLCNKNLKLRQVQTAPPI